MVCLGFEPETADWQAWTNPLSYVRPPHQHNLGNIFKMNFWRDSNRIFISMDTPTPPEGSTCRGCNCTQRNVCNSCRKLLKAQTIILRLQNLKAIKILVCNSYTTLSKLLLLWLHRQRVFEAFFVFCFILRRLFYTVLLSPKNHLIDPTYVHFFKKNGPKPASFCLFSSFPHYTIQ